MTSPKPRITQVLWKLDRAGAERVVFDVMQCLADRYEFRLIAAGGGGEMEAEFRSLGIEVVLAPERADKLTLLRFLGKELREHRPDLLHTHLGGDVWAGAVAVWQRIHPWISTIHNEDRDDPWVRRFLRSQAARRVDHIACVSHVVKNYVHETYGAPLHRLSVIPNGIDLSLIQERPPRPFQDVPKLLCVGRLTGQKGQETLLRALAPIKRPWRLDICGDGPDRLRLERLTESLGLLPRVKFHGVVTDVKRRLAEADVFCFSSRWEGQGIAPLEAAASAVPLILSDLPVFHEWFSPSSAQFVTVDGVEDWTKAIELVLQRPADAIKRAAEARKIVQERGSREKMADTYAYLYDRWLNTYANPARK
jgi:glycosyltransferase involved in cell wall biosynthesis